MNQPTASLGVIGARSQVGSRILAAKAAEGCAVTAFTRVASLPPDGIASHPNVTWLTLPGIGSEPPRGRLPATPIPDWIVVANIWSLPSYFPFLEASGARRLIALSSTSRFTKPTSSDPAERDVARRLADAEARVEEWAGRAGVAWTILRPTLIYGGGRDRNITEMAAIIRRLRRFPLLGRAEGLRQPVHVDDVAAACLGALASPKAANRAYNISGGEILAYREMAARVFAALGRPPKFLPVPLWAVRPGIKALQMIPRFRHASSGMAERMNTDMVFGHDDAARDFGFAPRPFVLTPEDLTAPR